MDVKVEPALLDYIKVRLKDEDEEVLIDEWDTPLVADTAIKQEFVDRGLPIARRRTRADVFSKLSTERRVEVEVWPTNDPLTDPPGPERPASWWQEYLVDYLPEKQLLACLVCGGYVTPVALAMVRRHVQKYHPHSLRFTALEKRSILEAWNETAALLQETQEESLHVFSNPTCTEALPDSSSGIPAEIEVAIDPEDLPGTSKCVQVKEKLPSRPVLKKLLAKKGKKAVPTQSSPEVPTKGKCKYKKNLLEKETVRKQKMRSVPASKGTCMKYAPTNVAPAEIHTFSDGSFPAGFYLKLYSRAQSEPSWRQESKRNGSSLSDGACPQKVTQPAETKSKSETPEPDRRLKSKGAGVVKLSVRVCRSVALSPETSEIAAGEHTLIGNGKAELLQDAIRLKAIRLQQKGFSNRSIAHWLRLKPATVDYILSKMRTQKMLPVQKVECQQRPASENLPVASRCVGDLRSCAFLPSWREEYLMDYVPAQRCMVCMVCQQRLITVRLAMVKRHIVQYHADSLGLPATVRQAILEGWEKSRHPVVHTVSETLQSEATAHQDTGQESRPLGTSLVKVENSGNESTDEEPVLDQPGFQPQWRHRYLVDLDWRSGSRMVCMVCGMGMSSLRLCAIKRHARRRHRSSLTYTFEKRKAIVEEWMERDGAWLERSPGACKALCWPTRGKP